MSGKGAKGLAGKGAKGLHGVDKSKAGDKKKPTSRSARAGLQFPVGRVHRLLKVWGAVGKGCGGGREEQGIDPLREASPAPRLRLLCPRRPWLCDHEVVYPFTGRGCLEGAALDRRGGLSKGSFALARSIGRGERGEAPSLNNALCDTLFSPSSPPSPRRA